MVGVIICTVSHFLNPLSGSANEVLGVCGESFNWTATSWEMATYRGEQDDDDYDERDKEYCGPEDPLMRDEDVEESGTQRNRRLSVRDQRVNLLAMEDMEVVLRATGNNQRLIGIFSRCVAEAKGMAHSLVGFGEGVLLSKIDCQHREVFVSQKFMQRNKNGIPNKRPHIS